MDKSPWTQNRNTDFSLSFLTCISVNYCGLGGCLILRLSCDRITVNFVQNSVSMCENDVLSAVVLKGISASSPAIVGYLG